jgi:mRNA-degrading endonuclease toxin of MazEF toxin-antitoxin module
MVNGGNEKVEHGKDGSHASENGTRGRVVVVSGCGATAQFVRVVICPIFSHFVGTVATARCGSSEKIKSKIKSKSKIKRGGEIRIL